MAWRLAPSRRVLVAAPSYLERHGTPASLDALAGHRGIFYTNRGGRLALSGAAGAEIVRACVALRVNNGDMMRDAAIAGLGIALLPLFIVGDAIAAGTLRVIGVGAEAEPEFIVMAHPEGRRPSAKLRALAEFLRARFGTPPYWENGSAPPPLS